MKIVATIDVKKGVVYMKRGLLGKIRAYDGEWFSQRSVSQIVEEFCRNEVADFEFDLAHSTKNYVEVEVEEEGGYY